MSDPTYNFAVALLVSCLILFLGVCVLLLFLGWRTGRGRPKDRPGRAVKGTITMSKTLQLGGSSTATVTFTDKAGNTVGVASTPVWSISPASVANLTPAADGMSCNVVSAAAGTATITVTAEGDPTPGVDPVTVTASLTVVDEATGGNISFN